MKNVLENTEYALHAMEYSEKQQAFHYIGDLNKEVPKGWVRIMNAIKIEDGGMFAEKLRKKFKKGLPSSEIVIKEAKIFFSDKNNASKKTFTFRTFPIYGELIILSARSKKAALLKLSKLVSSPKEWYMM